MVTELKVWEKIFPLYEGWACLDLLTFRPNLTRQAKNPAKACLKLRKQVRPGGPLQICLGLIKMAYQGAYLKIIICFDFAWFRENITINKHELACSIFSIIYKFPWDLVSCKITHAFPKDLVS